MTIDRARNLLIGAGCLIAASVAVPAFPDDEGADASIANGDRIVEKLKKLRPDLPVERVARAPVANMFMIELEGGTTLYATADGRYLFAGDLYEIGDTDLTNLAEARRKVERKETLSHAALGDMAVFAPAKPRKAVITVFTDVDCSYCRKLHLEVPRLNALGVEVRYLAFPRGGIESAGYEKIVTAWCSADRNDAITRMKRGEKLASRTCKNPVADQYQLGIALGVTGTPAIVLEDGEMLPGYLPADELAKVLGIL